MRGITFVAINDDTYMRHSADDWGLVMSEKSIGTPMLKRKTVELNDRDGVLDYTSALRGVPSYSTRTLSFKFEYLGAPENWTSLITEIRGFLHGQRVKILEPDDDEYYYLGIAEVSDPSGGIVKTFTVTVNADTWKYPIRGITTVSRAVTAGATMMLANDWKPVSPTITTTGAVTFEFGGTIYSIAGAGTFRFPRIIFRHGVNNINLVSGSGTITFTYQEGAI
jgi:hypothetical protein